MSIQRLLEIAARDGAVTADLDDSRPSSREVDSLLEAWSRERHQSIEAHLLLQRVERLLNSLLKEETLNTRSLKRVSRLLQAIQQRNHDLAS